MLIGHATTTLLLFSTFVRKRTHLGSGCMHRQRAQWSALVPLHASMRCGMVVDSPMIAIYRDCWMDATEDE